MSVRKFSFQLNRAFPANFLNLELRFSFKPLKTIPSSSFGIFWLMIIGIVYLLIASASRLQAALGGLTLGPTNFVSAVHIIESSDQDCKYSWTPSDIMLSY